MAPRRLSPAELAPGAPDSCSCQLDSSTWNLNQRGQSQIPSLPPRPPAPQPSPSWCNNSSVIPATGHGIVPASCLSHTTSAPRGQPISCASGLPRVGQLPHLISSCAAAVRLDCWPCPILPTPCTVPNRTHSRAHHAVLRILLCAHVSQSQRSGQSPPASSPIPLIP